MEFELPKAKCKKCSHEWVPRQEDVRQCPNCKTAKWDIPKEQDDSPPMPEV